MARNPPIPEHLRWLKDNGHSLAPLTGTDTKALAAVAACWQLYAYTRRPAVLEAALLLASQMQSSTRPLARELIAWAMEWSDRDKLWPEEGAALARALVVVPAPDEKGGSSRG